MPFFKVMWRGRRSDAEILDREEKRRRIGWM